MTSALVADELDVKEETVKRTVRRHKRLFTLVKGQDGTAAWAVAAGRTRMRAVGSETLSATEVLNSRKRVMQNRDGSPLSKRRNQEQPQKEESPRRRLLQTEVLNSRKRVMQNRDGSPLSKRRNQEQPQKEESPRRRLLQPGQEAPRSAGASVPIRASRVGCRPVGHNYHKDHRDEKQQREEPERAVRLRSQSIRPRRTLVRLSPDTSQLGCKFPSTLLWQPWQLSQLLLHGDPKKSQSAQ